MAREHREDSGIVSTSESKVETLLASLSDVQVRQMLLTELKKEVDDENSPENQNIGGPGEIFGNMLRDLSSQTNDSERRLHQLWAGIPNIIPDLYKVFLALCPLGTSTFQGAMTNFILVLLFVAIGLIAELLIKKFVLEKHFNLNTSDLKEMTNSDKFFASVARELPDFIGLLFFFGASYFTFFAFAGINSPLVQLFFLAILLTISLTRIVSICLHILLSPSVRFFRILPIECGPAKNIHRLMIWTIGYIVAALIFSTVTRRLGAEPQTVLLMKLFFATLLLVVTGAGILYFKNRVK